MPEHPIALALIREAGVPIAAPSANRFMQLSPTTAAHVREAFGDTIPVLDGGPCRVGIESTVVSITSVSGEATITLLRPGAISATAIAEAIGRNAEDIEQGAAPAVGSAHAAPGMHERHYSPRTPLVLTASPDQSGAYLFYAHAAKAARVLQLPHEAQEYAAHLYSALHQLDRENWPVISVEPPPDTPEWAAVRDRLHRAAAK
jgi:L-threonylcarbamoyladenylate synthase